jgi:hypothetical protein
VLVAQDGTYEYQLLFYTPSKHITVYYRSGLVFQAVRAGAASERAHAISKGSSADDCLIAAQTGDLA